MRFADWIKREDLIQTEVARRLGITQGHVSDLVNNRFWPSRMMAASIWCLTKGEVTANDFLTQADLAGGTDASARPVTEWTGRKRRPRKRR